MISQLTTNPKTAVYIYFTYARKKEELSSQLDPYANSHALHADACVIFDHTLACPRYNLAAGHLRLKVIASRLSQGMTPPPKPRYAALRRLS